MVGQRIYDNRDVIEIKESERRALSQAEVLKTAFNEHGLELRIKAAKETEVACQQRLADTEAEIADLRVKLDDSDRDVMELTEAIKIKDGEAEAYISEIEVPMKIQLILLFYLETQKISHGVKPELILLWSLPESSLTRTRLLLT